MILTRAQGRGREVEQTKHAFRFGGRGRGGSDLILQDAVL